MKCSAIAVALAAMSCARDSPSDPPHAPPVIATPLESPGAAPARVPEVVVATEKTSTGRDVIAVGSPRMQVTGNLSLKQALRLGAKRLFAVDRDEVKVWELDEGRLIARYSSPWDEQDPVDLAVSPDGAWMAAGRRDHVFVFRTPFLQPAFWLRFYPDEFSADSRTLLGFEASSIAEVEVAGGRASTVRFPTPAAAGVPFAASRQGPSTYLLGTLGAMRWNPAAQVFEMIAKADPNWHHGKIAERAPIAVVSDGVGLRRLDLVTGALMPLTEEVVGDFVLSPSGERIALRWNGALRVLETRTGKQVAVIPVKAAQRLAYSEDENVIAYVEDRQFVIHDLVKGRRSFPEPARFQRWLTRDTALVAHGRTLEQLAVPSRALTAAPATPPPPAGVPAWATWVTPAADGSVVAAEPSPRSSIEPRRRLVEAWCKKDLRLWTAKGGERQLSYTPVWSLDPCWQIGGGLVLSVSVRKLTVHDPRTGQVIATLDVGQPPGELDNDDVAHEYFAAAVSPDGKHLALWWRRADVWAPEDKDSLVAGPVYIGHCPLDFNAECKREYFAEVWSLAGRPRRLWQQRPPSKHVIGRTWQMSKLASGPIAFTHDGKYVLFGFDDGDVAIHAVNSAKPVRVESLHRAEITRIEIAPGDGYVFTEDAAGEQRIWPLDLP